MEAVVSRSNTLVMSLSYFKSHVLQPPSLSYHKGAAEDQFRKYYKTIQLDKYLMFNGMKHLTL